MPRTGKRLTFFHGRNLAFKRFSFYDSQPSLQDDGIKIITQVSGIQDRIEKHLPVR